MRRIFSWLGLLAVALAGMAATFAALYFFAPIAPFLWLLILLPLACGAVAAALLARPLARPAGIARETAATLAAIVAILPLSG